MQISRSSKKYIVALIILDIILLGIVGFQVVQKVSKTDDSKHAATSNNTHDTAKTPAQDSMEHTESPTGSLARNNQNTQRKNDASVILAAVDEFTANNNGQMPTMIDGNQLMGDSEDGFPTDIPTLESYTSISLSTEQERPVTTDQLVLVVGATCATDGGATLGATRSAVTLYGLENADGTFTGTCTSL